MDPSSLCVSRGAAGHRRVPHRERGPARGGHRQRGHPDHEGHRELATGSRAVLAGQGCQTTGGEQER